VLLAIISAELHGYVHNQSLLWRTYGVSVVNQASYFPQLVSYQDTTWLTLCLTSSDYARTAKLNGASLAWA